MSKKLSRRDFLRSTSYVAAAGILAACAPQAAPTSAPAAVQPTNAPAAPKEVVKISYWHGWSVDTEVKTMEGAVKLFNDSHTDVQVVPTSGKTNDAVLTAVSGGNPPDSFSIFGTSTLAEWANKSVIMDVTPWYSSAKIDTSQFFKGAVDTCVFKGKYYGTPIEVDACIVYYNKGLFKDAGLDPEKTPQTMEEFYDYAIKLTKTDANNNVTQLGYTTWVTWMEAYLYGGMWWDPATGNPTANAAGNVASLQMMADYNKKFGADKISTFNSQQADNPLGSLFLPGKVAMTLDGDWITQYVPRFSPTMDWGMFPLPPAKGHEDRANSTHLDGAEYVIPNGAKHPNESWEFVSWMATSKEACGLLQKGWGNTATIKSVLPDPQYAPNKTWQPFVDLMIKGQQFIWPPIAISSMYQTEFGTTVDAVRFGKQEPQAALDDLQSKMMDELKKTS
jgi:multiple sugar transport system substrate-binding protein